MISKLLRARSVLNVKPLQRSNGKCYSLTKRYFCNKDERGDGREIVEGVSEEEAAKNKEVFMEYEGEKHIGSSRIEVHGNQEQFEAKLEEILENEETSP
eukprot:UN14169